MPTLLKHSYEIQCLLSKDTTMLTNVFIPSWGGEVLLGLVSRTICGFRTNCLFDPVCGGQERSHLMRRTSKKKYHDPFSGS
jgi:hypothetical protein